MSSTLPNNPVEIGARLVQTRVALDMNQAEFARFVGFTTQALANYEKGYRRPDLDQAFKIVRATGVTLDWIYLGLIAGLPMRIASKLQNLQGDQTAA